MHGGIAKGFQHGRGFRIEEGHSIGHLVIDLILNVQLIETRREDAIVKAIVRIPKQRPLEIEIQTKLSSP